MRARGEAAVQCARPVARALLAPLCQRIRDVREGPDELLYLLTDETDGAVLRIEPAE